MEMNRKGEVFTMLAVWIVVAICVAGTAIVAGPKLVQAVRGNNQNVIKQEHRLKESLPVVYASSIAKDGTVLYKKAGDHKRNEVFTNVNRENPPETWMQKFFGLGLYAILICAIIGGIITALGGWKIVNSVRAKLKTKLDAKAAELDNAVQETAILNADAKQIVQSVDAGWGVIKQTIELNRQLALAATDPVLKAQFQAKADVLTQAIADMKKEMDSVQDIDTYNRVQELMKNDE